MFSISDNGCIKIKDKLWINYSWDGIRYPSKNKKDSKTFKKINSTIALNILYNKEMKICPAYISKLLRIVKNK